MKTLTPEEAHHKAPPYNSVVEFADGVKVIFRPATPSRCETGPLREPTTMECRFKDDNRKDGCGYVACKSGCYVDFAEYGARKLLGEIV